MDISSIPRSFWHAVSLCMIVATFGLLFIAFNSSSVTIEIANAKINLASALAETKEIKSELERENERLKLAAANPEIWPPPLPDPLPLSGEGPAMPITTVSASPVDSEISRDSSEEARLKARRFELPIPKERFKSIDDRINAAQQTLEK